MRTFISFDEARQIVLAEANGLGTERCSINDALGRILAEDIISQDNIPPFASSAMDGYAVRSEDVLEGALLEVIEHIPAGQVPQRIVTAGSCARIMTGAPIPEGADAIIPREVSQEKDGKVQFSTPTQKGKHIRPAAEDVRKGDLVFVNGQRITPPVVGMLATLGKDTVRVSKRPNVVVFSTGDEVVSPEKEPGPGQIRNSNGPALRAQVLMAGGLCPAYVHLPDNPATIREAILANSGADFMIFSGGVSVGDHDYVKEVLDDLGMELMFWKVRQRPGKPLAFGRLGKTLVLGLPGNPVSSSTCFMMYGNPIIEALLGAREPDAGERAVLLEDVTKVSNLHYFARGILRQDAEGLSVVSLTGPQGSNLFGSVVKANCILHLPEGVALVEKGTVVQVDRLSW
ncbi:molybdopterin molybdotransferase MoeA [bacterium]|nr:molybdopterin molybdotransferase MoeA [bacterium]